MWSFRTPGAGPGDFPAMLAAMRAAGGLARQTGPSRFLFALRWKLGALLRWDAPSAGVGARVASLRDRLPADLRDAPRGPDSESMPLKAVYELDMEAARELANKTVHTVMHLGWVRGRTATTSCGWPSSSSPTAGSGGSTWPPSRPSGISSSIRL
nr:hypothetical protein GCM10020093_028660 [Planobispora longispora]